MTIANVAHQDEIDFESAAMLKMSPEEAQLVKAIAWQLAKDSGLDDWRLSLKDARVVASEWVPTCAA